MASSSSSASTPSSSDGSGKDETSTASPRHPVSKRNPSTSSQARDASPSPSSSSPNPVKSEEEKSIGYEYYEGCYDEIRFGSYRTAAKLRALQHRTGLVHIDIWNMIEAFRENGLNTMETRAAVKRSRLETLVVSLYGSLSKRLPPSMTSSTKTMASWLFSWILTAFSTGNNGKEETSLRVRTLKTLLATLCAGKLMDKLRYIFSQLADSNGHLVCSRFRQFLKDVSKIPASIGEADSLDPNEVNIFSEDDKVTVNDFLETMMSDPGPQCLSWLLVLHRIANAENSRHPIQCSFCRRQNFRGLRYKSERSNYHLCQSCFWRGKISAKHKDDIFKEYNTYKGGSTTPTSGRDSSSKKSTLAGCIQDKGSKKSIPRFPEKEKPLDLSNMIPASPQPSMHQINGFQDRSSSRYSSMRSEMMSSCYGGSENFQDLGQREMHGGIPTGDDEHQLIARYAKQLARQEQQLMALESIDPNSAGRHALIHSRQLVKDLEKKNREIMRNIHQLREQSRQQHQRFGHLCAGGASSTDPELVAELEKLRLHKDDLEMRLTELQNTRKDLMEELQELMKLLKVDPYSRQSSGQMDLLRPPSTAPAAGQSGRRSANNSVTDVSGLGLESGYYSRQNAAMSSSYPGPQKLLPMMYINEDGSLLLDESYRLPPQKQQQQQQQHHVGGLLQDYNTLDNPADSQGSLSE